MIYDRDVPIARLERIESTGQWADRLVAADHDPTTLEGVCLAARLSNAARREGFTVIAA